MNLSTEREGEREREREQPQGFQSKIFPEQV
jgi:hypothetical protein